MTAMRVDCLRRMKKWKRRIFISSAAVVMALLIVSLIGWRMLQGTPDWYQPQALTADERAAAAQRVINKLVPIQNQAAFVRGSERHPGSAPSTRASEEMTVSFTDQELTATFQNWSVINNAKSLYERFVLDPCVVMQDGRLILAGKFKELDTILSLHFAPQIDEQGRLSMRLERVLAGKLPLPASLFDKYQQKITASLNQRLPAWRRSAVIDPTGIANSPAVEAATGQQLLDVLHDRPTEPVVFLQLVSAGNMPLKLRAIEVKDHAIQLTVQPMNPAERAELLERIREPQPLASGQ
jgi:hypothetical protein